MNVCSPWRHILMGLCHRGKPVHGAGAPSAPSEEGAGAPKGYKGATEGERTRGCCLHKGVDMHKFIQVSFLLCVRLYKVLLHTLGVSLLPSRRFYPLYAVPPPSSEGGEAATAARHRFTLVRKLHSPNSTLFQIPHYSRLIAAHIQENSFYAT